jgi:hypothetical protein
MAIKVNRAQGFVDFCTDLALRAEWETANEALVLSRQAGGDMLVDAASAEAAALVQDLEKRMQDAILRFKIQAISRKHWQELGIEHGPREGNAADARLNVDTSTFFDVVAQESIIAVNEKTTGKVVDFDPKAEWVPLADEMTDGQYNEFVEKFLELNRGSGSNVPFSRLASVVTQGSEKK